jgi:adenylate kinase family enzyme
MRRILVVGMSGAGKTTAARRVGARLGLTFHEMDALALGPNWSQPPGLVDEVTRITAEPAWIFDSWGYPAVRELLWQSADTILWLDYPATVVLPRLIRRSVIRTATNEEVFGGNRETLREWLRPRTVPALRLPRPLPRLLGQARQAGDDCAAGPRHMGVSMGAPAGSSRGPVGSKPKCWYSGTLASLLDSR